jgi:hypothetical protein
MLVVRADSEGSRTWLCLEQIVAGFPLKQKVKERMDPLTLPLDL